MGQEVENLMKSNKSELLIAEEVCGIECIDKFRLRIEIDRAYEQEQN